MQRPREFVLATSNPGKIREFRTLLAEIPVPLSALSEYPEAVDVAETGSSFAENAALKASEQALALGRWTIAEDSGICVDALNDAPGIFSARMAGDDATDEDNNTLLLNHLAEYDASRRQARYQCAIAVSDPAGKIVTVSEGSCRGRILTSRHGAGGFGYDPLFEIVEYHRTFGELGNVVKLAISHRARATRAILPALLRLAKDAGGT
jgi:XTP/dITP diphosphohydrolase